MSEPIETLLDSEHTRTSVAHTAHARAYERAVNLGIEIRAAFEELHRAKEQLRAMGVDISVSFQPPLDEAWMAWRAKKILTEPGKKIGR